MSRVTRQSTLFAGLRDVEQEGGVKLRPHHRDDATYTHSKVRASPAGSKKMTVKWLRAELKEMGWPTTGLKADLLARYENAVAGGLAQSEESAEESAEETETGDESELRNSAAFRKKSRKEAAGKYVPETAVDPIFKAVVATALFFVALSYTVFLFNGSGNLTAQIVGEDASKWIYKNAAGFETWEQARTPLAEGHFADKAKLEDYSPRNFFFMLKHALAADTKDSLDGRRYFLRITAHSFPVMFTALSLYLVVICYLLPKKLGGERQQVKFIFALWNAFLAAFAIWGAYNTVPHFFNVMLPKMGWEGVVCAAPSDTPLSKTKYGVAIPLFIYSKIPELLDTLFIVLTTGKSPAFLQWYHHATVLTFCWMAMAWDYGSGIIFAVMNYSVHSVMYSYFVVAYVLGLFGVKYKKVRSAACCSNAAFSRPTVAHPCHPSPTHRTHTHTPPRTHACPPTLSCPTHYCRCFLLWSVPLSLLCSSARCSWAS